MIQFNLTNIFQMGWNHQLDVLCLPLFKEMIQFE